MRMPAWFSFTGRDLRLGVLATLLVVVPIVAGLTTAGAAASGPEPAPSDSEVSVEREAAAAGDVLVSDAPVGQVPDSMDDALTRLDSDIADLARVQYEVGDAGPVGILNGGVIPLGDGLEAQLTVSPYPPSDFDIDVALELTLDGQPVTDAAVETTWDMVFMYHGPFTTEMPHAGQGRYAASYDFFMFGPWELATTVEHPDRPTTEFAVSIYVWPTG